MDTNKPPLYYNLGAVIRETGLNPDTLRAWERRYNLPQPTRSDGGQRLYSQKDLEILHWLIKKQNTGLRISQAAELYHTQVEAGIDPLEEERLAAQTTPPPVVAGENLTAYRDAWLEAALKFDTIKAEQVTAEAFSLFPPETVALEILFAGLRQIGNLWYHGEATVQQEHFASALVTRRLNALIAGAPAPTRPERIVIAAPPEEDHTLAPMMINYLLRRRGYDIVFLGADVPARDFRSTIEALAPDLIILTAHLLLTAASMLELVNELGGLKTKLAFGGPVFINIPELRSKIPGTFLGDELQQSISIIEHALQSPDSSIQPYHPEIPSYLAKLRESLPEIESRLAAVIDQYPVIVSAPTDLISRYLLSAIRLGDISYLNSDVTWISGLLTNFKLPTDILSNFLKEYAATIEEVIGPSAEPASSWLLQVASTISDN